MLIDFDKFVLKIESNFYDDVMSHHIIDLAKECEADDAVPVVRCKDCRYGVSKEGYIYCPNTDCGHDHNFYCADGERKDGKKDDKS